MITDGFWSQSLLLDLYMRDILTHPEIHYNQLTHQLFLFFKSRSAVWRMDRDSTIPKVIEFRDLDMSRYSVVWTKEGGGSLLFWNRGIGGVHLYDSDLKLKRVLLDEDDRRAFESGALMTDRDGTLYNVGGYGLWEYRNQVLKFNRVDSRWDEIHSEGGAPPEPRQRGLGVISAKGTIYFLWVSDMEEGVVSLHEFNVNERIWHKKFDIRTGLPLVESTFGDAASLNLYDPETHRLIVPIRLMDGGVLRSYLMTIRPDLATAGLFDLRSIGADLVRINLWHSPETKRWVMVGQRQIQQVMVDIIEFDAEAMESRALPLQVTGELQRRLMMVLPVLIALFSIVAVREVLRRKRRSRGASMGLSDERLVQLSASEQVPSVRIKGKIHDLGADVAYQNLWRLIRSSVEVGRPEIPVIEVDEHLFLKLKQASQQTRLRNRYINVINKEAGTTLLQIKRSQVDRRFKVLGIDLSQFSIQKM